MPEIPVSAKPIRELPFAEIYQIRENLWAIDEIRKTTLYVYAGREKVLLLDTGFGLLDLKQLVSELAPGREIVVVNSHGHGDHNSGNNQFDRVYVGRFDEPTSHEVPTGDRREHFLDSFFHDNPRVAGFNPENWHPGPARQVLPLRDGDLIDLGGLRLEVIEAPGHSLGSICLFDRENGFLFTGDLMLTWQVWGQLECSTTLKDYSLTLDRLATLEPQVREVFPAHGRSDNPHGWPIWHLPPRVLSVYAEGTRRIVEGQAVGVPFHDGPEGLVVYFDIGGMVYDPTRLGV